MAVSLLLSSVKDTPEHILTFRYDDEADVLYLNFARAADASDSELLPNDVLARYDDLDKMVGLTVLHAFKDQSILETRINDAIRSSIDRNT
jgi:uncharacterized protein YuzE